MVMLSSGYDRTVTQQVHRAFLTFNLSRFVRVERISLVKTRGKTFCKTRCSCNISSLSKKPGNVMRESGLSALI